MADDGNCNGNADSLVTTPVLISHVGTEKGNAVNPELVEGVDGIGGLWSLSKCTGDTLVGRSTGTSSWVGAWEGSIGKWLVDEVGDWAKSDCVLFLGME